jgi:osmotically inducible protein OsmC
MAVERTGNAEWQGDLTSGSGTVSTESGAVRDATIKWSSRAEAADENTSPEELIAAAHAACVSMALAHGLAEAGTPAQRIESQATSTFDQVGDGFRMTKMHLRIRGTVDGLDEEGFRSAAEDAEGNCPVSQALSDDVEVTVDASLA